MTIATDTDTDTDTAWVRQWAVLSGRSVLQSVREGDLAFAVGGPIVFFLCFYVPLRNSAELSGAAGTGYAQYLLPIIVLQAMLFTAMAAADRAAGDVHGGMGTRLRSLPVGPLVAMCARASANLTRAALSLIGAIVIGSIFGFRFHGIADAAAFAGLSLLFGLAICLGADALGAASRSRESAGAVLLVPQLVLTMLSTGIIAAEGFPSWIRPFVANQPVSQVADALRGLAAGSVDGATLARASIWTVALGVAFTIVAVRLEHKER